MFILNTFLYTKTYGEIRFSNTLVLNIFVYETRINNIIHFDFVRLIMKHPEITLIPAYKRVFALYIFKMCNF